MTPSMKTLKITNRTTTTTLRTRSSSQRVLNTTTVRHYHWPSRALTMLATFRSPLLVASNVQSSFYSKVFCILKNKNFHNKLSLNRASVKTGMISLPIDMTSVRLETITAVEIFTSGGMMHLRVPGVIPPIQRCVGSFAPKYQEPVFT